MVQHRHCKYNWIWTFLFTSSKRVRDIVNNLELETLATRNVKRKSVIRETWKQPHRTTHLYPISWRKASFPPSSNVWIDTWFFEAQSRTACFNLTYIQISASDKIIKTNHADKESVGLIYRPITPKLNRWIRSQDRSRRTKVGGYGLRTDHAEIESVIKLKQRARRPSSTNII